MWHWHNVAVALFVIETETVGTADHAAAAAPAGWGSVPSSSLRPPSLI
jgi:hypothetical protein